VAEEVGLPVRRARAWVGSRKGHAGILLPLRPHAPGQLLRTGGACCAGRPTLERGAVCRQTSDWVVACGSPTVAQTLRHCYT
jgi:hypothetical protein